MSSAISFTVASRLPGDVALKSDGSAGVKSDTLNLGKQALGFHANADGTVAVNRDPQVSGAVTLQVTQGQFYPYQLVRVYSTNTSLSNAEIVLLYGP